VAGDLYHQAIVEAARSATGHGRLDPADGAATVDNPLCGDRVTMTVRLRDGRLVALGHEVRGCALCGAAAAVIGARAVGETVARVRDVVRAVDDRLAGTVGPESVGWPELEMFDPVRAYRSRHDCVRLPFQALAESLEGIE
jgi:nitrogen fixation NifU-like protein